jgi:hypothetical protein
MLINIVFWALGVALIAFGYQRARGPWARYQQLKEQDANAARYNAWRGGVREDTGATGASVAMQLLRAQAQRGFILAAVGIALVVLGFLIK